MLAQVYYCFFGLVAIAGGAMGYARAKSKASLIAGGVSGALLFIAGLLSPSIPGFILALVVSIPFFSGWHPNFKIDIRIGSRPH